MKAFVTDAMVVSDFITSIINYNAKSATGETGTLVPTLVLIKADGSINAVKASAQNSMIAATNVLQNSSQYHSWCIFHDAAPADTFVASEKFRRFVSNQFPSRGPPQTAWTEEEAIRCETNLGIMMETEDTKAEVEAVAVGLADDIHIANSAGSNVPNPAGISVGTAAGSNVPNPAGISVSTARKSDNSDDPGDVEAPVSFDMSAIKLNFGKTGESVLPQGVELDISAGFPHKSKNYITFYVCVKKVRGNIWHLDAKFINVFLEKYVEQVLKPQGKVIPLFFDTMKDVPVCNQSKPHKFKRTKKGWTSSKPMFLIRIPKTGAFRVDQYVHVAFETIASNFRASCSPRIGQTYVNWLRANKETAYNYATGESSNKKNITHEEFIEEMHIKLLNAFALKVPEYNVPLDKWLTYGHIKEFLVDRCGYESWDDIPNELKKSVIGKHPRTPFPDWHSTVMDEY